MLHPVHDPRRSLTRVLIGLGVAVLIASAGGGDDDDTGTVTINTDLPDQ